MNPQEAPATQRDASLFAQLGVLLIEAGMSVTDVRIALESVRDALAPEAGLSFAVLPSAVMVSREDQGGATAVSSASPDTLSMRQSARANRLVVQLTSRRIPLSEIPTRIEAIRAVPFARPALSWIAGSALIAAGLAALFRCPWWAVAVATLAGLVVGAITNLLHRIGPAAAIVPFVSAFVSTLLVGEAANLLHLGPVPLFGVCAPIAILVPGALITNALLELTAQDIVTGSARLVYGVIMLGFMIVGIMAAGSITGLRIDPDSAALIGQAASVETMQTGWAALPPLWMSWLGVVALAVGVGIGFGAGLRLTVVSAAVMTVTYGVLVTLTPLVGTAVATGATAAGLFIAARLLERLTLAVPAAVAFRPAFLLLVPGTVGLVALASFDLAAIGAAPLVFVGLCLGTKIGSVVVDTPWRQVLRPANAS